MKNKTLVDSCLSLLINRYSFFKDKLYILPYDLREHIVDKMNPTHQLVDGKWYMIHDASQSKADWGCYKY